MPGSKQDTQGCRGQTQGQRDQLQGTLNQIVLNDGGPSSFLKQSYDFLSRRQVVVSVKSHVDKRPGEKNFIYILLFRRRRRRKSCEKCTSKNQIIRTKSSKTFTFESLPFDSVVIANDMRHIDRT
uniref:Uncharacterized protein n=1 Tax=Amphora coffeiformis TaxID=265554 RepID=A0A7S3L5C5_9STRA